MLSPLSQRRQELWTNFVAVLDLIKKAGLKGDIWVDGSFLTEKIDPGDVDLVFDVPIHAIENANVPQAELLKKLSNQGFKRTERLHTFIMFTAPVAHAQFQEGERIHQQWQKDFGVSYIAKTPKGIAVIEV